MFHFVTLIGMFVSLLVGGSLAVADNNLTTIDLPKAVHFVSSDGSDVVVGPGKFQINVVGQSLQLFPEEGKSEESYTIQAHPFYDPDKASTSVDLSDENRARVSVDLSDEDRVRVSVLRADGTGAETVGSYSGIQARATAVYISNPVAGQVVSGTYTIVVQSSSPRKIFVKYPISLYVWNTPGQSISCPAPKVQQVLFASFKYYDLPLECTWRTLELSDNARHRLQGTLVSDDYIFIPPVEVIVRNKPLPSPPTGTFNASNDFSGVQGPRWFYLDSLGRQMTFNGAQNLWQGAEQYLLLKRDGGHPGNGADAVRRWVAPSAGTVRIFGIANDTDPGGGGGVTLFIRKGGTVLWQQAIANGTTTRIAFDVVTTVTTGTAIDFVINKGADGNNSFDSTSFNPTIVYALP
jgi:hypothetical protein